MNDHDDLVQRALVQEAVRTPAQRTTILQLLNEYGDFRVEGPLSDGCLELRKDDQHLCFVTPDGTTV